MNNEIKILDAWKNKKYILAYSFNYDSAREQNDKLLDYITNLQNNWYDLKTYCKLERHESNNMKEGQIYNEIITKMEQLERGE